MMTDIEIARSIKLQEIDSIAKSVEIDPGCIYNYGKYMAKLPIDLIDDKRAASGNLILVTAITPTKAGIGKTTLSIGLTQGLNKLGKKAIVALREPSLGPCLGMKGGATGGGYSQVLPMEDINLHFTGDFHAITSAHNMIAALLDNYIFQNRKTSKGLKTVLWKRVLDINDRNLRHVVTGLGGTSNGTPAESGFDITPASEIMAILCLSNDIHDLRRRIEKIILGYTFDDHPFTVADLGIAGSVVVLLKNALNPNFVQTTENNPAIIHGGPFANIAHGCNSILATKLAMSYADYVVTEAGFGADLGAEKFFNIKCRKSGLIPKLTVLVVTAQGLKMHGGVPVEDIKKENIDGLKQGFANLDKHIANIKSFGQNVVIAFNKYSHDTDQEICLLAEHCRKLDVAFAVNEVYAKGGEGAIDLAKLVVNGVETNPSGQLTFTYRDSDSIRLKIEKVAQQIYGASAVKFSEKAVRALDRISGTEIERYPVCIAKTQYSFSDNPKAYGVARQFDLEINDIAVNNGAEFVVAISGSILRMPGLPKDPQANRIDLVNGLIEGLT